MSQTICEPHLELIYCEDRKDYDAIQAKLKTKWPEAKFEDASDYIHEYRFEVSVPCKEDEFILFALSEHFAMSCFGINLMRFRNRDRLIGLIRQWKSTQPATPQS